MSGHKRATVTIGQEEYDRLREAEIRMRSLPDISAAAQQAISQQSVEAFRDSFSSVEHRLDQYEQALSRMSDHVISLESSKSQQFYDMQVNLLVDMQQSAGTLWDRMDQLVNDTNQRFQEAINANHQTLENQIAALAEQFQAAGDVIEQKQNAAESWIEDAQKFLSFIGDTYDCDQFAPGQFERQAARIKQAYQNYLSGFFEASLSLSQQAFLELTDLHIELERAENEWQIVRIAVLEALNELIALAENCQIVQAIDLDGNPLPYTVDVNYWMEGRLNNQIHALDLLKQQIELGEVYWDTETLKRFLLVDFPGIEQAIMEMVLDARVMTLNSQLRINIADLVVRALQDQGFALDAARYDTDDVKQAYQARLYNREGNEVLVNVVPGENGFGENELHLESHDANTRTEHELLQRWKEVSRSLRYYGLQVGEFDQVMERGSQNESIAQRFRSAAKKIKSGITTRRSEEGNGYRANP